MFTTLAQNSGSIFNPQQYVSGGRLQGWSRGDTAKAIDWNGMQAYPTGVNPLTGTPNGWSFRKQDPSSPTGWSEASVGGMGQIDTNSLQWKPYENTDGWAGPLIGTAALAGVGGSILGPAFGMGGTEGLAGMGNGAFLGEGIASGVPAWDAAAGLSAAGGAGAAANPLSSYLTSGASEGSTIGNSLTGAGGSAGAVGAGTTAGNLGTIGNAVSSVGNMMGKKTIGSFGLGDALNLGGNLLNSYLGYNASNKAADAQINAANQANQLAKYMYDQTRQDNMPALEARNAGLTGYQNLLKDPTSVTQDPGYKFGFTQGMNAYDNSGAARGMRLSGAQAKALTQFGQDYAGTKYNEALGRYGQLAGIGQPGANTIAGAGQNYSNQYGQNTTGAGNAAAAGYIGGANAISGGISNFLRSWQESNLLKQLGMGG